MKDHPLFNEDPNDTERRSREIDFINIYQFVNGKRTAISSEWEAEQLQTIADVFEAVGEGNFELVGRENQRKRVVDRVLVNIKAPRGAAPTPSQSSRSDASNPAAQQPPAAAASPGIPTMQIGAMAIPAGMDPTTAMMLALFHTSEQRNAAQLQAQREDSRLYIQQQTNLMIEFSKANASLLGSLVSGLAQFAGHGPAASPGVTEIAANSFIKGVEVITDLKAGIAEGSGAQSAPTDWSTVSANIVQGLRTLKDVAAVANAPPGVPPGVPTGG